MRLNFKVGCLDLNWGPFDSAFQRKFNDTIFIVVTCLDFPQNVIENLGICNFIKDFGRLGTKY